MGQITQEQETVKMPRYTLGLDIGNAPVGAALLGEDKILGLHVRTFDRAEIGPFGVPLNLIRRESSSTRKRIRRRSHRLAMFRRFFHRLGVIGSPTNEKTPVAGNQKSILIRESKIYGIKSVLFYVLLILVTPASAESSIEGYWKSIDEQTSKASGYWKLEVKDNRLLGYLVNYPDMKPDNTCNVCTGKLEEFYEKPIQGTAWINLRKNKDGVWKDGYIIDSGEGKKYKAQLWVEDGNLMMRGYIGFFYRTQTWLRTDQATAEQATFGD